MAALVARLRRWQWQASCFVRGGSVVAHARVPPASIAGHAAAPLEWSARRDARPGLCPDDGGVSARRVRPPASMPRWPER